MLWSPGSNYIQAVDNLNARAQVEANLVGNQTGLTFDRLVLDLCSLLNSNPKIADVVKPIGVYTCLIEAARRQTTFGDAGLWVIPDKSAGGVRTQESRKFQIDVAIFEKDINEFRVNRVYEADKPVEVIKDDLGEIIGIKMNTENFTAERPIEEMIGIFIKVSFNYDAPPRVFWLQRLELDRMKARSQATDTQSGISMWRDTPEVAYELAAQASIARKMQSVRTRIPGMATGIVVPKEIIDAEFEEVGVDEDLGDELSARSSAVSLESLLVVCKTPADVTEIKLHPDFKNLWGRADVDGRNAMVSMCKDRKAELQSKLDQAAGGSTENSAASPGGTSTPAAPPEGDAIAPSGANQEASPKGPPVIPPFPLMTTPVDVYVTENPKCGLNSILQELEVAWGVLAGAPGAIEALVPANLQRWNGLMENEQEPLLLGQVMVTLRATLADSGLPCNF
jgi:hypothetical protein